MGNNVTTWLANNLGDKYWESARFADELRNEIGRILDREFSYPPTKREEALQRDGLRVFQVVDKSLRYLIPHYSITPNLAILAGDALADSPWEHAEIFGNWWATAKNVAKHLVAPVPSVYSTIMRYMADDRNMMQATREEFEEFMCDYPLFLDPPEKP
jgi:hypothetical protein